MKRREVETTDAVALAILVTGAAFGVAAYHYHSRVAALFGGLALTTLGVMVLLNIAGFGSVLTMPSQWEGRSPQMNAVFLRSRGLLALLFGGLLLAGVIVGMR